MGEEDEEQEKTEEPSQYRLEEFRNKGIVASSKEVVSVLVLFSTFMAIILSSLYIWENFENFYRWITGLRHQEAFTDKMLKIMVIEAMWTMLKCILPIFVPAMVVGVAAHVMQTGIIFTSEPLNWNLERINPVMGFKRIFSLKSLGEVVKGLFKFTLILAISYMVLKSQFLTLTTLLQMEYLESFLYGKSLMVSLGLSILMGLACLALLDFGLEKYFHRKKLLQSKQQLKEETKEKEGNPEIKQRIRSIQREMTQKRMMADVPKADVIITNPTHFSVAIKYDKTMVAPLVVAKGVDHLAMKIREIAKEHDIPMIENKPLARTLYKTVKVGESVPRTLYKAVAEILAYVYKLKKGFRKNK